MAVSIVTFMVFVQRYRTPGNFWVSLLFPAFGRTLWALPVCFLIMAGSTQFSNGEIFIISYFKSS